MNTKHLGLTLLAFVLSACGSHGGSGPHITIHDSGTEQDGGMSGGNCPSPLRLCAGSCVDTTSDPTNCGRCGNTCTNGTCNNGVCSGGSTCTGGQMCNGNCVDTTSDPSNCGTCNHTCTSGVCSNSVCQTASCQAGQKMCNGSCIDTTSDPSNCGLCGKVCSSGVCTNGVCQTMTGGMTGCNGLLGCLNACSPSDSTCPMKCASNTTTTGKQLYTALVCCIFGDATGQNYCNGVVGACPQSTNGICDQSSTTYNQTNCDNCIMQAQMAGGKCVNQLQSCTGNTP